jgi:demethylspheroidene O-methyltransferase
MGLQAALGDLRNRLISDPRFRRMAKGFAPTRGNARANARALFDLIAGFVYSQTVLACTQIDLFNFLKDGPQPISAIAARGDIPLEGATLLARAASSLKLLEPRGDDSFALGALGAALVDEPGLAAMIQHHQLFYSDLADPLAVLRGGASGQLADFWGYGRGTGETGRPDAYSALMAATLPMVAEEVFAAVNLKRFDRLLDVGGGEGAFLTEAARQAPRLALSLFDLPPVAARARERLTEAGLAARAEIHAGSFLTDTLPTGADLISLVRIIHDHSDEDAMCLLRACRDAIAPGGTLMLAEPMADARGAAPMGDAYFGFYLAAMGGGKPRSHRRLTEMLAEAGFGEMRVHRSRIPLITDVITARATRMRKS